MDRTRGRRPDATPPQQMEDMKGKKSVASTALAGAVPGPGPADPRHRVRLRRRHGFVRHGRLGPAPQDPGGRVRRRHRRQQVDLQPDRRLRRRGHPPGPHRPGQAEDRVGDPRVGRQLHGQPALRRDRRAAADHQRRRCRLRGRGGGRRRIRRDLLAEESVVLRGFASTRNEAITEAGELLVDVGAVDPSYVASMHEREAVRVHAHGQRPRDPARHQRGQVGHPAHARSRSCATPTGSTGTATR